jgi:hypothetical protein
MATSRNGFIPVRWPTQYVQSFPAAASTNQSIAKGDAVAMLNGVIVPATAGQDPGLKGWGVVIACYTTAGRPFTFNSTKIIASGGVGRVDVCFDPMQEYYVQCVTSAGPSNMGKNVIIDVSASNALTGISGMAVSIPASASTNDLFKIVSIGPFDELARQGNLVAALITASLLFGTITSSKAPLLDNKEN